MKPTRWAFMALAGLAVPCLLLTGCAVKSTPVKVKTPVAATTPCAPAGKLTQTIAPEAQLVSFTCAYQKYKGVNSLHFTVKLKNVSAEEQRYRVNIFLEDGRAVGGLIPRQTKKGLVKPGAEASFTYPVQGLDSTPTGVHLLIKTVSK